MGHITQEHKRNDVLDRKRDIDRERNIAVNEYRTNSVEVNVAAIGGGKQNRTRKKSYVSIEDAAELWNKYKHLARFYARKFGGGYDNGNSIDEFTIDSFLCAVRRWDRRRGTFNSALRLSAMSIASHRRQFDKRNKRSRVDVPVVRTNNNGEEYEFLYGDNTEFKSAIFIDSANELPEFEAGLVRHCIENAHKYANHKNPSRGARLGMRTGESSGIVLDYCGGSLWRARRATRVVRAWLRGHSASDIAKADKEYTANKREYNRRFYKKGAKNGL